ncbi:MAG TPA: hypothetical protein VM077_00175 [Candidatus Limnocylindrales bacterium]|nr:hypothetical protein [Candidatus Limnocylindrales bacterium]
MNKPHIQIRDEDMLTPTEQVLIGGTPMMVPWNKEQWSIPQGVLSRLENGKISREYGEAIRAERAERRYYQAVIYDGPKAREELGVGEGEIALVKISDIDPETGNSIDDPAIVIGSRWDPDKGVLEQERDVTDKALTFLKIDRAELNLREGIIKHEDSGGGPEIG